MNELDELVLRPTEEKLVAFSDLSFGSDEFVDELVKECDAVAWWGLLDIDRELVIFSIIFCDDFSSLELRCFWLKGKILCFWIISETAFVVEYSFEDIGLGLVSEVG